MSEFDDNPGTPPLYQEPSATNKYPYNRPIGFIEAYCNFWINAFNFKDRTTRSGFWWVALMDTIITIILNLSIYFFVVAPITTDGFYLEYLLNTILLINVLEPTSAVSIAVLVWTFLKFIPSLSLSVRRFHDIGKRWTWYLILLIPIVGIIIYIVYMLTKTQYPPYNPLGVLKQV